MPQLVKRGRRAGRRHRSDRRARPACRLHPEGAVTLAGRGAARARRRRLREGRARLDGGARRGDARAAEGRVDRLRLRQQPARTRRRSARAGPRVRDSRFRAGVRPSAVLPRRGTVPLGRAVRQSAGHRGDGRSDAGVVPASADGDALDREGARAREVPGAAGAHLLARIRRTRRSGREVQLAGEDAPRRRADRDWPRSSRLRIGRIAEPRNRRHAATARTRSPTGRC